MKRITTLLLVIITFWSCDNDLEKDLLQDTNTVSSTQDIIYIPAKDGGKIALLKYDENFYSWGDMLLNKDQIKSLSIPNYNKSVAISNLSKRWNNLYVPYRFHPNFSSTANVRAAMNRIRNRLSCINFVELSPGQIADSFIEFRDITSDPDIGGNSALGRQGGLQVININPNSFDRTGTSVHEIGHALGLFHEHVRADRNNFIIVNENNIDPSRLSQFQIPQNQVIEGTFDFTSAMLYGNTAFLCDSCTGNTLTRLNGGTWNRMRNFSAGDATTVAIIHGYQTDERRLNNKSFDRVLIDYEASQDTQYREEEFYLNFSSNLTSPLTVRYEIVETVSNVQTHPSGQQTTITNHTITLPAGQSSYLITTLVTVDQYYDYGEPDGPQYTRSCNLFDYCGPIFSRR